MSSAFAIAQRFANIDAQAEQLTGFDQRYEQVDAGDYRGTFFTAEREDVSVFIETTSRNLVQRGAGPIGRVSAVSLVREGDGATMSNGVELTSDDILVIGPGGSYDAFVPRNSIPTVVDVPVTANSLLVGHAERFGGAVRKVSDRHLAELVRAFSLRTVESYDPETMQADVQAAEAQMLMMSLLTAQAAATGSAHPSAVLFREAYNAMLANLGEITSITDLAREIGASRRSMEQAFSRCVGMSPARFWRTLRLNNVRRLLESGQWAVTNAAMESGLVHLGRMSANYRDHFGELPSETAARSRVT